MIGLEHYKNNILDMRNNRGMSIRQISAALSEQTGEKISSSAVFRFLKAETATAKPETLDTHSDIEKVKNGKIANIDKFQPQAAGAPMPDGLIMMMLHDAYGHMKQPDRHNWSYVMGGMRTFLSRKGIGRDEAIRQIDEYLKWRGWIEPQEPRKIMHAIFNPPEERTRGMRIY